MDALEAIAPLATSEAAIADEVSHLLGLPATTRPVTVLQPTMLAPGAHVDEPFLVSRMAESTAADLMLAQINWCTTVYAQSDDPEILVEATYSALGQDTPDQWARGQKDDATEPVSSGASIPCQQCGNELPEHARFCRQCGQRVTYTDSGQAWTGGREPLSSQEVDDLEAIEPLATSEAAIADEVNHLLGLPAAQRPLTVLQPTMLARGAEVDEPFLVSRMAQSAAADLTLAQIDWCTTEYAKNDDPKRLVELVSQATRGMPKSRTPRPSLPPQKAPRPIDLPPPPVRMRVDYD